MVVMVQVRYALVRAGDFVTRSPREEPREVKKTLVERRPDGDTRILFESSEIRNKSRALIWKVDNDAA